jgi:putative hydrolase of the HAD superfamily
VPNRLVLLDFDGTLAYREGLWSGCAIEVLDEHRPGHGIEIERFRAAMRGQYPWNRHEQPHPELSDPQAWWLDMETRLAGAFAQAGAGGDAALLARALRERFIDPSRGWRLFDDTIPALEALRGAGWRAAVLSNHVPELAEIASGLGLEGHLEAIFSSALTGWEKPHPEAFAHALAACGHPEQVWMVGDNPLADVAGADSLGIPAVLVRGPGDVRRRAEGLMGAVELLVSAQPPIRTSVRRHRMGA